MEQRVAVYAGIALLLPLFALYGPSDPRRYSIVTVAALWLAEVSWLDGLRRDLLAKRVRRGRGPSVRWLSPWTLVALAAVFVAAVGIPRILAVHDVFWRQYRQSGVLAFLNDWDDVARGFCSLVEPDAVVAAGPSPWSFFYRCGNPTMWTPNDLSSVRSLHRFIDEHHPEYIIASRRQADGLLRRSPRLERVAARGAWILHRVRDSSRTGPRWKASPPLHLLGTRHDADR